MNYEPNFELIDVTARRVFAPAIRASDRIQTGLDDIQQRNKERQQKLKADYDAETKRINEALGRG